MPVPIPESMDRLALTDRLLRVTDAAPFTSFRFKKGQLHAAEVVGSIQVGSVRINILPKVDAAELGRDKDFLLNILQSAGYLSRTFVSSAAVRAAGRDPLEAMISEVASEMSAALREGIPRRYEERCEDSMTLRGRIDFTQLSTRLPGGQSALPIRYSPLSIDNNLARCIKWIASALFRLTRSSVNRQVLATILSQLEKVDSNVNLMQFDSIQLSRYESRWAKPIAVGRELLKGNFPDPTYSGKSDAFSMLFPMQHLYERAMRSILVEAMRCHGIEVKYRTEPLFLLQESDSSKGIVRLKPDYVFYKETELIAVGDAKWKRITQTGRRAHGVEREDLYQINAYLTRYKAKCSIIFVPHADWMNSEWTTHFRVPDSDSRIHLVGVDIESLVSHNPQRREASLNALSNTLKGIVFEF